MKFVMTACSVVAATAFGTASPNARAAPDEIQVYTEELDSPGESGLELHMNFVPKGEKTAAHQGAMPSHHLFQVTPEFSYGVTKTLEAGLYLPFALTPDGRAVGNGVRLRMKYIAPRDDADRIFWGVNSEVGYFSRRVSESRWAMELRPIVGYRSDGWLVSFNPILDIDLSTNVSREPKFEPALKLGRAIREGLHAGIEYYGEFGPIHHRLRADERSHYLYGVVDVAARGVDLNLGVGRGFTAARDSWIVKAIIALPFH